MFRAVRRTITWSLLIASLITSVAMRSAPADGVRAPSILDLEATEILATGDRVPGLGIVGEAGFQLLGIDDSGRVLIRGEVSDGRHGFYWVDGGQITPIWVTTDSPPELTLWGAPAPLSVSRNGNVATLASDDSGALAIYTIEAGSPRRVAGSGDVVDAQGNRLCAFLDYDDPYPQLAVNDSGVVAFVAWIGTECEPYRYDNHCDEDHTACLSSAVFVVSRGEVQQIDIDGRYVRLRGVARDGTVVVDQWVESSWRTIKVGDAARRELDSHDFGLEREWDDLREPRVAMSDSGELAFVATHKGEPAVFRTNRNQLIKVVNESALALGDGSSTVIVGVALNDSGDVVVHTLSYSPDSTEHRSRVLLYPASGQRTGVVVADMTQQLIPPIAITVNNAGVIGFSRLSTSHHRSQRRRQIVRWTEARLEPVLDSGAAAPDGGIFAVRGLTETACLGADGSVASGVINLEGQLGLVCGDGLGWHTIVRAGDAAPGGGFFGNFQDCIFTAAGDLFFSASRVSARDLESWTGEPAIYRAGPNGIERLVGIGEATDGGDMIMSIRGLAANANGHLLIHATTPSGSGLYLRRDGSLKRIVADDETFDTGETLIGIDEFAITDNDEVLFSGISSYPRCERWLLTWRDGWVGVLLTPRESVQSLGPLSEFSNLDAKGRFALFSAYDEGAFLGIDRTLPGLFRYDSDGGVIRRMVTPDEVRLHGAWPDRVRVLGDGRVAAPYFTFPDAESGAHRGILLLGDGDPQDFRFTDPVSAETLGVNERDNILLRSYRSEAGAARYALLRTGPQPGAAGCPTNSTLIPAPPLLPTLTPTSTPTSPPATPTPEWWPPSRRSPRPVSGPAAIEIEPASGSAGARTEIRVVLHDGGHDVAGTQNDIAFAPPFAIAATAEGTPDCTVNPDIKKQNTVYVFLPNGCEPGRGCKSFRALVVSFSNTLPILDGSVLYTCRIDIASDAEPGAYELPLSNVGAATPDGEDIDTIGHSGAITVTAPAADTRGLGEASASAADGCQIGSKTPPRGLWLLVPIGLLWLWRTVNRLRVRGRETDTSLQATIPPRPVGLRTAGLGTLLPFAFVAAASVAAADDARQVLATGDEVPGFGVIGQGHLELLDIDDYGRLLFFGQVSTGAVGAYWVDGNTITPVCTAGDPDSLAPLLLTSAPHPRAIRANSAGSVAVLGQGLDGVQSFYVIEGAQVRRLVDLGQVDTDGYVLCSFTLGSDSPEIAINDAGEVAFAARIAQTCGDFGQSPAPGKAIYLASSSGLTRVVGPRDSKPYGGTPGFELIGLAGDGRVLFGAERSPQGLGDIFSVREGLIDALVGPGILRPGRMKPLAASDSGKVLVRSAGCDGGAPAGVFRIDRDEIVNVATEGQASYAGADINNAGDVVLDARLADGPAVALYPSGQRAPSVLLDDELPDWIFGPKLNNRGEIALTTAGTSAAQRLLRWTSGRLEEVLRAGTPAPGGGVFAVGGDFSPGCLAPDGSIAIAAINLTGERGLVCRDTGGLHPVVRAGDRAPGGGNFWQFGACVFTAPGEIVFSAAGADDHTEEWAYGVYRARHGALDRLIASQDRVTDGSTFTLESWAVNRTGSLVASGSTPSGRGLFLRRETGLEAVVIEGMAVAPSRTVSRVHGFAIADDDTVVFSASLSGAVQTAAILAWQAGGLRVIAESGDPDLPGPVVDALEVVDARGTRVLLRGYQVETGRFELFVYDLRARRVQYSAAVDEHELYGGWVALTEEGRVAIGGYAYGKVWDPVFGAYVPLYAPHVTLIGEDQILQKFFDDPDPNHEMLAFSERNVVLRGLSQDGRLGTEILLFGPDVDGFSCPNVPAPLAEPRPTEPVDDAEPTLIADPKPWWQQPEWDDSWTCGDGTIQLSLESATGAPGDHVEIRVLLETHGTPTAATQNDITFDPSTPIAVNADGKPDCSVNPDIEKDDTSFSFQPAFCTPGDDCRRIRALVVSYSDVDTIRDGSILYTCRVDITGDAGPGAYDLPMSMVLGSTPFGEDIPATTQDGSVIVTAAGARDVAPVEMSGTRSGGCQLDPSPSTNTLWPLIPIGGIWLRRHTRRWKGRTI